MSFNKDSAAQKAKEDLARRLGTKASEIELVGVEDKEFPNGALGAPEKGEMAMQMISDGWRITLKADGKNYEYRADKYQLRLRDFKGKNHVVES